MNETYTDWTLVSLSPLPAAWIAAAVIGIVLATGLVLWAYRGARRAGWLSLVRTLAALVVLGFLLQPALQLRAVRKIPNRLAIVLDRSLSMGLATENGRSRYENVLLALEKHRAALDTLGDSHIVEWFDLEGTLSSSELRGKPAGEHTDLLAAFERTRSAGAGRPLAGLVLISDGADNVELEGTPRGTLSSASKERLLRLQAPVNTVDATATLQFRDVAVANVISDEFAFVHNTLEIEVEVASTGFEGLTLPVTLRREGDIIATQEAVLKPGEPTHLLFKTKPDKIGEFVYAIGVPTFAGDAIPENNTRTFVIQVIRDKIRVLQVTGQPSWDERFLRQHLKENPNVDLISFFILRTATDDATVPEDELSLIPFPVDKLFTTELHSFDVVIFQNFDYRPYPMARYLRNIRNAAREGLGFVMIGGAQSFSGGGYAGTAMDEIIPVHVETGGLRHGPVASTLTDSGRHHPVTHLTRGSDSNTKIWRRLPSWSSINVTGGLKPGATALLVASDVPGASRTGEGTPLIAVMDTDQGRSMAICTDSMWRWRFSPSRDGGASERAYHRFWSNALRWLVRDPEHSRVRVLPSKRRFEVGQTVAATISVLGQGYQPVPYAHVQATLERGGAGVLRVDDLVAGEDGIVRQRYEGLSSGAYRLTAVANAGQNNAGRGTGVFVVESRSVEVDRSAPRPDLLRAVAKLTGGAHGSLADSFWENLQLIDPDVVEIDRRRNIDLWDNGWALAVGVLLLCLDWALRRRNGYL